MSQDGYYIYAVNVNNGTVSITSAWCRLKIVDCDRLNYTIFGVAVSGKKNHIILHMVQQYKVNY